jgi:hypothetical protein
MPVFLQLIFSSYFLVSVCINILKEFCRFCFQALVYSLLFTKPVLAYSATYILYRNESEEQRLAAWTEVIVTLHYLIGKLISMLTWPSHVAYLNLCLPSGVFPWVFTVNISHIFHTIRACYLPDPSYHLWFNRPYIIRRKSAQFHFRNISFILNFFVNVILVVVPDVQNISICIRSPN